MGGGGRGGGIGGNEAHEVDDRRSGRGVEVEGKGSGRGRVGGGLRERREGEDDR